MDAGGVPVADDGRFADPRWQWPEYDTEAVVELRIHGIGGEGPETMTRDPHPVMVGGDAGVGFWRARDPVVRRPRVLPDGDHRPSADPQDSEPDAGSHVREVVSWGGTTSGHGRSSLWVLLLPFALFNAAGRMAPPGAASWRRTLHQSLCRLLALSMTVAIVALFMGTMVDLLALQCASQPLCVSADLTGGWLLTPLEVFADDAAALVALVALVPVTLVYLLRMAGRRELTTVGRRRRRTILRTTPAQQLHADDFWENQWPAWRLRGMHTSAGYAWAVVVLAATLPPLLPDLPTWIGLNATGLGLVALVGNAVIVALPRTAATRADVDLGVAIMALRAVALFGLGSLVGTAVAEQLPFLDATGGQVVTAAVGGVASFWALRELYRHAVTVRGRDDAPSGGRRDLALLGGIAALTAVLAPAGPGRVATAGALQRLLEDQRLDWLLDGAPAGVYAPLWGLVLVQAVLLVGLVGTSVGPVDDGAQHGRWRTGRGPLRPASVPGNLGAPVIALLSLLIVTAVGAGLQHAVLDWLGTRVTDYDQAMTAAVDPVLGDAAARARVQLALPWWKAWTAFVFVVTATLAGVAGGLALLGSRKEPPSDHAVRASLGRSMAPWSVPGGHEGEREEPQHEHGDDTHGGGRPRPSRVDRLAGSLRRRIGFVAGTALTVAGLLGLHQTMRRLEPSVADTVVLIGATVALTVFGARALRRRNAGASGTASRPPSTIEPDDGVHAALRAALEDTRAAWLHQELTRRSGVALLAAVVAATVVAAMGMAGWLGDSPPMATAVLWVTGLLPLGALFLVNTAREDRTVRRNLGRIWDVLAFWPRLTHPFSPPSYGEALVPAVAARVISLRQKGHPVVLAGHSQGSVVALATVLQLDRADDVHVVTYGSPLRLLYEGFFPTVFGGDDGAIARGTPDDRPSTPATWHNLMAFSEPIGTPLWSVPTADGRHQWDVLAKLPWRSCPVCGWARGDLPTGASATAADVTISDPDRLVNRADEADGRPAGHSSYRRSREMDEHLSHLAATAATHATAATQATRAASPAPTRDAAPPGPAASD